MHDPFPIPPIPWLSRAAQPFADYANFPTLPLHVHEVLISFLVYTFINIVVAPILSRRLFPVRYNKLSYDRRVSWDVHVVSLVQSCTINALALWVMFADKERSNMDWQQRVWGYTGACGMIQALALGYFLWDLMVTVRYVNLFGYGMLAHAISALVVFSFGFRPFVNFYSTTFILYELSSPFLNFHWFFDKLDMTGSLAQLINGLFLLSTFFCCRLVWGTYQSVRVYQDIWAALHHKPSLTSPLRDSDPEMMRFATVEHVPVYLALLYLSSNLVLNTLNFYWFRKMIDTLRKRFQPTPTPATEKPLVARSTGADGKTRVALDDTEVRRRKPAEEDALPAVS